MALKKVLKCLVLSERREEERHYYEKIFIYLLNSNQYTIKSTLKTLVCTELIRNALSSSSKLHLYHQSSFPHH